MLAGAQCQTFEAATSIAIEELERQIEKRKNQIIGKQHNKSLIVI